MVHAHLDDKRLCIVRGGEERERHADQVVEVALGLVHPVTGREHRCAHVLRRGLAHRSRDTADDPLGMPLAPGASKPEHELLRIVVLGAQDGAPAGAGKFQGLGRRVLRHDRAGSACLERLRDVGIAVHPLAFEGDEERPCRSLARIYDAALDRVVRASRDEVSPRGADQLINLHP